MFCENCGNEVSPGNTFCTNCGAPMKQTGPVAPEASSTTPVSPPAAAPAAAPPKPGKGINKKWIIITAAVLSVVLAVAVVLVLVLVVFKSAGPESTMNDMFKAMAENNLTAMMETIDPTVVNDKELKSDFKDFVKDSLPPKGATITGLEYKTTENGDKATVKITGGTAKMKVDGKTETFDLAEDSDNQEFFLVKKDGKWYLTRENFMDFFAKQDLIEANSTLDEVNKKFEEAGPQMEQMFADLGTNVTSMQQFDQQVREKVAAFNSSMDSLAAELKKAAKAYELVSGSEDAGEQNRQYADLRLEEIDITERLLERTKAFFNEFQSYISSQAANPTVDANAFGLALDDMYNRYMADINSLNEEMSAVEAEIEAVRELIGL